MKALLDHARGDVILTKVRLACASCEWVFKSHGMARCEFDERQFPAARQGQCKNYMPEGSAE